MASLGRDASESCRTGATTYERIYRAVRRVPPGRVATYGQIASMAGLMRGARQVGYALNALGDEDDVPWHRVINAQGRISARAQPICAQRQQARLQREGIVVGADGRIDLARFGWTLE